MKTRFHPERHHRRSLRLKDYDYREARAYFVTICTQDRACTLGEVDDGVLRLSDAGRMVQGVWDELSIHYPSVSTDVFVVMPNHVHGVVILCGVDQPDVGAGPRACPRVGQGMPAHDPAVPDVGAGPRACPRDGAPGATEKRGGVDSAQGTGQSRTRGQPRGVAPTEIANLGLPDVVHRFKSLTTKRYTDGVRLSGWPAFSGRLWQRNYYEHIIRGEAELDRIREYIVNNPAMWEQDQENPQVRASRERPGA